MSVSRLLLAGAIALAASGADADTTYHPLASGSFSQNWTNTGLITTDDIWTGVPSIEGYRGDDLTTAVGTDPRTIVAFGATPLDVNANRSDPSVFASGGIAEFESGTEVNGNPTVAFQGSGTSDAPFLVLRLNTTGCTGMQLSYTLRDIDTAETTTAQPVVVQTRVGEAANFSELTGSYVAVANNGGTTPGSFALPAGLENQAQVQIRWITTNAVNVDAMIGVDDIHVSGSCGDNPPTVTSTTPANNATGVAANTNLTIQFNEAVTTNPGWFGLSCSSSGAVAVAESGTGASRTLDPVPTLTPGETCTATLTAANVIDQDGTPDPMAANYVFGFTVAADLVPTVSSTTPASAATNVVATSNLSVQFSEAVTTNPGWFGLSCTTSGNVAVSESGTGATRTLDPTPVLASGEQCTATITAANVIDQDGTPNPMAANYVFSFTVAVDNPPTVTSTTPANGVAEVPVASNLVVNFSEPVTVGGSWYSISCANSGVHAAVVSGGPSSYTLNPNVNFDLAELCTVTLTASLIQDVDGTPDPLAANYIWSFTSATSNFDYYASVNASNPTVLRTTLHALIKDHVSYPYTGAGPCNPSAPTPTTCDSWDILDLADQNPANPAEIIDLYQNDKHPKAGGGNANYNREHTWPNSHGFNDLSGNDSNGHPWSTYTDTHMLYLADITYNANRGNSPYDDCTAGGGCTEDPTVANNGFGGQGGAPFPGDSNWKDATKYMTWNHRKGDVARAILYMDVRYEGGTHANGQPEPDLIATDDNSLISIVTPSGQFAALGYMGKLTTLLAWHAADPPDAQEILRNGVIYGFQGNRNPFIDHPEWVACLWQGQCGAGNNVFANGFE